MNRNLVIYFVIFVLVLFGAFFYFYHQKSLDECDDPVVGDLCIMKGRTCGNCFTELSWYEYDLDSDSCVLIKEKGCAASVPFKTIENCELICLE